MKKLFIILLSVLLAGCSINNAGNDIETGSITESVMAETEDTEKADADVFEGETAAETAGESRTEDMQTVETADNDKTEEPQEIAATEPESTNAGESAKQTEAFDSQKQSQPATEQKQEETKPEPEPQPQAVGYSPDKVVSLAIAKCQAGGMITTEDNLQNNLSAGKITQEEYKEYYPLDGLESSYYSVFVNVDLSKAATISGERLGSEEEIAQHIADMLLLESDPVFNIRYAGTTQTGGETFYEFRCHR